jgi:threonine dehydratase
VLLHVQVGAETFRLCRELCDGVLLVDNAAISAAIKDVFNETRSILEPAGAVAVAGAKAWLKENGHQVRSLTYSEVHHPE